MLYFEKQNNIFILYCVYDCVEISPYILKMELFRYLRSLSRLVLLLICVSTVQSGLIDNVNEAILSNFYEDIADGTHVPEDADNIVPIPEVDTNATSTLEALSERFIKQFTQHGDGDVEVVNQGLAVVCSVPASLSACKEHLRKQVSTLHHY